MKDKKTVSWKCGPYKLLQDKKQHIILLFFYELMITVYIF